MSSMLISFNGTCRQGQFLGDTLVSVKTAFLFAKAHPCSRYFLALSPDGELNFLWRKFIDAFHAEVVYDNFDPGNNDHRYAAWDRWRKERKIDGKPFDIYKELYRRIDGAMRQNVLCKGEKGLGRKNVFEYLYYGQEGETPDPGPESLSFGADLIYYGVRPIEKRVLIAPYAKCQGNATFTFEFWDKVVRKLVGAGVRVTVNHNGAFCEDLASTGLYRKVFPKFQELVEEIAGHKLVACGNTGVGWVAGATGVPLLAMQPPDSNMQDYRYEWCGVKSLVEYLEVPDADYCVSRIIQELDAETVLTTGCYDILHAGHVRHLEESAALGTRLIVALNSDESVRRLKGEGRPVQNQEDRAAVLRALRCVDEVRVFEEDTAERVLEELRPAVLTNGCDRKPEEVVGRDFVEKYGGRVVVTGGKKDQSTTAIVQKAARGPADPAQVIREASALTVNPPHKLRALAAQLLSVDHVRGDLADLGTYRGGCALVMRKLCPERHLHLFDTWTGNPHNDPLCHHKVGEWAADVEGVRKVVPPGAKTHFYPGVFPGSAAGLDLQKFAFVYVDMDTFQSTHAAIKFFWPKMAEGGKMMFDDVPWEPCAGVQRAVEEEFKPERLEKLPDATACVVTKGKE